MTETRKQPKDMQQGRRLTLWCIAVLASVTAGTALWSWLTPMQADDVAMQYFFGSFMAHTGGDVLRSFAEYSRWFWADTNGRLANYLAPVVTLYVPRWLFSLTTGLAAAWLFYAIARQWGRGSERQLSARRFRLTSLLWLCPVSLALWPWRDYLMYPDYSLNYLYSTALNVGFMLLWVRSLRGDAPKRWLIWGIPLAIVGSMMHEGLSLPMLGACGLVAILRRLRIPAMSWWLGIAYLAGTIECTFSPAILGRAAREYGGTSVLVHGYYTFIYCTLLWVLCAATIWLLARQQSRRRMKLLLKEPLYAVAGLNAVAGAAICFIFDDATPRYGWVAQVYSTFCLVMIWRVFFWPRSAGRQKLQLYTGVAVALLAGASLAATLHGQALIQQEDREIRRAMESSPEGTVYRDIMGPEDFGWYTLGNVHAGMWRSHFQFACYNLGLTNEQARATLPADIEGFKFGTPLPGTARIAVCRGYLIGEALPQKIKGLEFRPIMLRITDRNGEVTERYLAGYPFTADGRTYFYYGPAEALDLQPERIDFPKNEKLNKYIPLPE